MAERLYTTYQVADLLGATPGAVVEWMQKGWLPFRRLEDDSVRISEKNLVEFLRGRGVDMEDLLTKAMLRDDGRAHPGRPEAAPREPDVGPKLLEGLRKTLEAAQAHAASRSADTVPPPDEPEESSETDEEVHPERHVEPAEEKTVAPQPPVGLETLAETEAPEPQESAEEPPRTQAEPETPTETGAPSEPQAQARPAGEEESVETPGDPTGEAITGLLAEALRRGASDVHLCPTAEGLRVRLRIDRFLRDEPELGEFLPDHLAPQVVTRLKELAGLHTNRDLRPQTGWFSREVFSRQIEVRLSTLPTTRGELLTLRMQNGREPAMADLPLADERRDILAHALHRPWGLITVACTPRQGRLEILRALLREVSFHGRSVVTVERHVEREIDGVCHSPIDRPSGYLFSEALRGVADQDADVVMVCDLRDPDTAAAALELAVEGRLVLAGLLANDPAKAARTLLEMNLDAWPLSVALQGVLGLRSVPRLCENCREVEAPPADEIRRAGLDPDKTDFPVGRPVGCDRCGGSGYDGILSLATLMTTGPAVRAALREGADTPALRRAAIRDGMTSWGELVIESLRAGSLSLEQAPGLLPR